MRLVLRSGFLFALAATQAVYAANEIAPWGSVAGVYSDNTQYTSANPTSATALDGIAGLRLRHSGALYVNADASALYRYYPGGEFGSQFLPAANALVIATIVPERFSLTAEDNLGQVSTQPFDALSQTNRQNANIFTVGPDVYLPFGTRDRVGAAVRYSRSTFGSSNIDSAIYDGSLSFTHRISELTELAAVGEYERVDYLQQQLYPRAEKDTGYLRFRGQSSRTYLVLEGGVETVKVGSSGVNTTVPHATVAVQRRISPRVTLSVEYNHGYSNASESLRAGVRQGLNIVGARPDNVNVEAVAEPFRVDRGNFMLYRNTNRGSAALRVTWDRERYTQNIVSDRTVTGADILFDRRLSPLWTVAAIGRYSHEKFVNTNGRDDSVRLSLGLTRVISRSFQVALVVERTRSTGATTTDQFSEDRASLVFRYAPKGSNEQMFDPVGSFRYFDRPLQAQPAAPIPTGEAPPESP
jgi:hypothetical protein